MKNEHAHAQISTVSAREIDCVLVGLKASVSLDLGHTLTPHRLRAPPRPESRRVVRELTTSGKTQLDKCLPGY
jgi:hypothetical protein